MQKPPLTKSIFNNDPGLSQTCQEFLFSGVGCYSKLLPTSRQMWNMRREGKKEASHLLKSRFHWKCRLGLQNHMIFICLHAFLLCMLCFYVYTHVCFHLISNMHIVRTFENRISFQTFEKWHNVSYRYVSLVTSETSDIWRKSVWREGWGKPYLPLSKTEFYSKS